MKKHRGSFDHGCHICVGKEPWFLKNHMKAHGPKADKTVPGASWDPRATINDVVQEEVIVAGLELSTKSAPEWRVGTCLRTWTA